MIKTGSRDLVTPKGLSDMFLPEAFRGYWVCQVVFGLLLFCGGAHAEVTVQSTVDRNQIPLGETVTVTVGIRTDESISLQEPKVPALDGFDLLNSWRSSSTSSRLEQTSSGMAFKTTRKMEHSYVLAPQRKGNLRLGSFEVNAGGKIYRTKEIYIEVIGGGKKAKRGQPQPQNQAEDRFAQLLQQRSQQADGYRSLPRNLNEAFFVQIEVDKTEAYVGEQILARWYIFARGQVENVERLKFPTLKGFWKEDIEAAPTLNFRQEVVNGVVYRKALLASHALFPIREGQAVIDEYKVKSVVRMASGHFGLFAFGKPYKYTKTSERLKIKVKPLPKDGQPEDFTGAVGDFDLSSNIEGRRFPVNQPFTLKLRFEGTGNAKLIDVPYLKLPDELELYDTKQEAKFFGNGTSYKDFELLIIPRAEGTVTIPPILSSVFNPDTGEYEVKETPAIPVQVYPQSNQQKIAGQSFDDEKAKEEPAVRKEQLPGVYVELGAPATRIAGSVWGGVFFVVFALLGIKARTELGWGNKGFDLNKVVEERFQSVSKKVGAGQWRSSGTEMANVTYAVLGELAGTGGASEEVSKIIDRLPPSVRRELGDPLKKLVERIQIVSFAPEEVVGDLKEQENLKTLAKETRSTLKTAIKLYKKTDES